MTTATGRPLRSIRTGSRWASSKSWPKLCLASLAAMVFTGMSPEWVIGSSIDPIAFLRNLRVKYGPATGAGGARAGGGTGSAHEHETDRDRLDLGRRDRPGRGGAHRGRADRPPAAGAELDLDPRRDAAPGRAPRARL